MGSMRQLIILTALIAISIHLITSYHYSRKTVEAISLLRNEFQELTKLHTQLKSFQDIENTSTCICVVPDCYEPEHGPEPGTKDKNNTDDHKYNQQRL